MVVVMAVAAVVNRLTLLLVFFGFYKQPSAAQCHVVLRNDVGRLDRAQLSSDIESTSVTDDSDADMITANKYNTNSNVARLVLNTGVDRS